MPTYTATAAEARQNFRHNPGSRWHQKDAPIDQAGGMLAFQRLRQPLFMPVIMPRFKLGRDDNFFAIGSCFARGIEKTLVARKMNVLSAASEFASFQTVNKEVTGLGFTNKYNTFSIYNELLWALDPNTKCPPESIVDVGGGLFCDPHITPTLELADKEETFRRRALINTVTSRSAQCRIMFITLGLVEVWRDTLTDTFVNSTPLAEVFRAYPDRYEFQVSDSAQNYGNLEKIHELMAKFGHPDVHFIITVSPVPLMATFSKQDVVSANTYSKSTLRTVAQEWAAAHSNVDYFPSYEIVQSSGRSTTWLDDLRHVQGKVVGHIMTLFLKNYIE
jgi:hypothetical protein